MPGQIQFVPRGPCAILPRALNVGLDALAPPTATVIGDQAVVDIRGPLTSHPTFGLDSYDAILDRVRVACASPAAEVVLRLDSPGGDVYLVFETARAIRAMCLAAGKRVCSYISGAGASAAYALACAGDQIYASSTSCVGSIGVIDLMVSVVRQDAAQGVDTATVTSGARKADGNPHVPLSEAAIAAHQAHVDELAGVFFAWVGERRGMAPEAVKALNAAVFVGARAAEVGLIDQVADFASLQEIRKGGTIDALARSVPTGANQTMKTFAQIQAMLASAAAGGPQASKYTEVMAALAAMAEEGDEADKDKAKKAMKKMLSDDKPEASADDKPAAAGGPPAEDKDKPAAIAAAVAVPGADLDLVRTVIELKASAAARDAREERATLLAGRPDLMVDPSIKAMLEKASLETVREICKALPKATLTPPAVVTPTVGATSGQPAGLPADESAKLKARMGLGPNPTASVHKFGAADLTIFGATDEQAAIIAAERGF